MGEKLFEFTLPEDTAIDDLSVEMVAHELQTHGIECSNNGRVSAARRPGVFEFWDADNEFRFALQALTTNPAETANRERQIGVYQWGDWYDYPGSYWTNHASRVSTKVNPTAASTFFIP